MGLFDLFKIKENTVTPEPTLQSNQNKISLIKEREQKVKISLEKKTSEPIQSQVVLVMDVSVSMKDMFIDHMVQDIVEKIVPVALRLDDNQELDCYIFSSNYAQTPAINMSNFDGYIDKKIIKSRKYNNVLWGGTRYLGVMNSIFDEYKKKKLPTFVIFVTDGDCCDERETEIIVKKSSNYPIFWQYVGIGTASFNFLERLDNMNGREVDNANFFQVNNINAMSDEELYNKLLNEFPSWIKEAKSKNIIK